MELSQADQLIIFEVSLLYCGFQDGPFMHCLVIVYFGLFQVSALPFPFNNVSQFEAVISHPLGSTWNPETSFRELVAPKVVTKLGQVIDPIEANDTMLKKKTDIVPKKLPERKRKKRAQQQKK